MNDINKLIDFLEFEWGENGFLYEIRNKKYDDERAMIFLNSLRSFNISDDMLIPKRLISLIWYLSPFLMWQRDRFTINEKILTSYDQFIVEVNNILEETLGYP